MTMQDDYEKDLKEKPQYNPKISSLKNFKNAFEKGKQVQMKEDFEKVKLARQCIDFQKLKCFQGSCLNEFCPLNQLKKLN